MAIGEDWGNSHQNWNLENFTNHIQFIIFKQADATTDYIGMTNDARYFESYQLEYHSYFPVPLYCSISIKSLTSPSWNTHHLIYNFETIKEYQA